METWGIVVKELRQEEVKVSAEEMYYGSPDGYPKTKNK